MHMVISLKDAGARPLSLQTYDLLSVVLPGHKVDDWEAKISQSPPGILRTLTAQEWERVMASPRFHTATLSRTLASGSTSEPTSGPAIATGSLHFGALQPGRVTLQLESLRSRARHSLVLQIGARTGAQNSAAQREPAAPGEPVPTC